MPKLGAVGLGVMLVRDVGGGAGNQLRDETYVVVHGGSSQKEDSRIVGPLKLVDVAAIKSCVRPVIEVVIVIHHTNSLSPVKRLIGPLRIGIVAGVQCQSCA